MLTNEKITVCSFFAGGGLLDAGFLNHGGFEFIWANELDDYAAACYKANIGDHLQVGDITKIPMEDIPYADVYLSTSPCTDYSTAGAGEGEEGAAGSLVWTMHKIVKVKRPLAFLMENVEGMVRRHKHTVTRLIRAYEKIGYTVSVKVLDSADFGVAQGRKRLFLGAIRKDVGLKFRFPKESNLRKTVREAFEGLPDPETVAVNAKVLGNVPNHLATWTSPTPERIYDVIANPRPKQWKGMRRLKWDSPSYTLTSHMGKDGREFLHPSADRRITVREALRLMGTPDTFKIPAEIPIRQQYFIVGNGVSTTVAGYLAGALYQQLTNILFRWPEKELINF